MYWGLQLRSDGRFAVYLEVNNITKPAELWDWLADNYLELLVDYSAEVKLEDVVVLSQIGTLNY